MLGRRTTLDTSRAEQESEPIRRLLKFERRVRDQIEKLQEQLDETRRNLRLTPDNIESVVRVGLEVAQQPPLLPVADQPGVYYLPPMKGGWASCGEGLAHPHTGEIRPLVFDPDLARRRDDVVLVHLNHRLVQMCLRLLRAEVWASGVNRSLHRVTARVVKSSALEAPAVVAYGRLVVLGGDQQRLHEEVITAGGVLREGRFSRFKSLLALRQALEAIEPEPVPETLQDQLVARWDTYADALLQSLEARQAERTSSLEKALQERCDKEVADITAIMTELRQSILNELTEADQPQQLSLFSSAERDQYDRNRSSLQARLDQIPQEIEQETALIRARFASPTARLFPLAITYLVPRKMIS